MRAVLLGVATAAAAWVPLPAQATADIPFEAEAYGQLDRLRGLGVVDHYVKGHRQLSRLHVQRLVGAAWARLPTLDATPRRRAAAAGILRQLGDRYGVAVPPWADTVGASMARRAGDAARVDGASVSGIHLSSPPLVLPGAGMTAIDALVNPLSDGRGGRRIGDGTTAAAELGASAELGAWAAAAVHPRAIVVNHRGGATRTALDLLAAYLTAGAGNARLTAGRVPVGYGQGMDGGLLASHNAPGLDMIQLRSDLPAQLPGFMRRIGPMHGALFLADLGPAQNFPHSKLAGWKVSVMPSPNIELGVSVATHTAGSGAPPASLGERIVDLLPLIDVLLYQDRDLLFSNKLAGVDARWRHARSGTEVYLDMMLDDFDVRRVGSSLWEDAGYVAGVSMPALGSAAQLRIDAEVQHTGLRFYEHVQFTSGITSEQRIIGLPLGPQGNALVTRASWTSPDGSRLSLLAVAEQRSGDQWVTRVTGSDDSGFRFVRTQDEPEERRLRSVVEWTAPLARRGLRMAVSGGLERASNHAFSAGVSRTNALAAISIISGF